MIDHILEVEKEKKKSKFDWYRNRGFSTILNVPVTPHSTLRNNIAKRLGQQNLGDGFKVMVREIPGQQAQHLISNVTRFNKTKVCGRENCMPCEGSVRGTWGTCWSSNPTYRIKCGTCATSGQVTSYIGESGYSANFRAGLHQRGLRAEDSKSVLWQHVTGHHGAKAGDGKNYASKFQMEVTGSWGSSARRLIAEGVLIDREFSIKNNTCRDMGGQDKPDLILNGKAQWYQPALTRMKVKPYF